MLTLLASLSLAGSGDRALWYVGHGSAVTKYTYVNFEKAAITAGAAGVDSSTAWSSDLTDYHLVVIQVPTVLFVADEVADLETFIAGGGTLVLANDNSAVSTTSDEVLNALAADLGLSTTFDEDSLDAGCNQPVTVAATHDLTDGISDMDFASSGSMTPGASATTLFTGPSGQPLVVEEGGVVLSDDFNILDDSCKWPKDNTTWVMNLWNWDACSGVDADGDGHLPLACGGLDCDDGDAMVSPDALEVCNGFDDDCDGEVDEGDLEPATWYEDADGDGYGNPAVTEASCVGPKGYVANDDDCDDARGDVYPRADEVCDEADQDCDGAVDEEPLDGDTWYGDDDGDSYGTLAVSVVACAAPDGYADNTADCDDDDALVHPGADEHCDAADEDCDGTPDEDAVDAPSWYADADGDGYGDPADAVPSCVAPDGRIGDATDCNDDNARDYPGADEYCDDRDNDCDGATDEDGVNPSTWYADEDGDGFGDEGAPYSGCDQPEGYVTTPGDCDDADADVHVDCGAVDSETPADTGKDGAADGGCGCAATPSIPAAAWLLGLGALARRRRR